MQIKNHNKTGAFSYFLLALCNLFLSFVGKNGEPISLALAFAACSAGFSPFYCFLPLPFFAFLQSGVSLFLLSLAQSSGLVLAFLLHAFLKKRCQKQNQISFLECLPPFALALSLSAFVALAPFSSYDLSVFSFLNISFLTQKVCVACGVFLLSACFSVCMKAIKSKLFKCRLQNDEIIFCVLLFSLVGIGICNFLGLNAYVGAAFFILLVFSYTAKSPASLLCAFLLSIPPCLVFQLSIARFFLFGATLALFSKSGKLACACSFLTVFFLYGYFDGIYSYPTVYFVQSILSAVCPALLFMLMPVPVLREIENKFIFYREKHLSRIAINRNRAAIGEQLYELSAVFKEIQSTFHALGDCDKDENAKEYVRAHLIEQTCLQCPNRQKCQENGVFSSLSKLVAVGCAKGKVSLIDIPTLAAEYCNRQSDLLSIVNKQLGEYQKYTLEWENAANGRALLASQAQGVSEILKNLALEQSEPLRIYTQKEHALSLALRKAGAICSEVLILGEGENLTLSLITFGKFDVVKIANICSQVLQMPMMICQRYTLSQEKYCCILRRKPTFDAAFGVAAAKKQGQAFSGDTHSIVKIDERRFLVALADGMGSGEYAHRISECTISLLESFYRAKMPPEQVLPTVNKLLTFHKEETFACVDIAIVNLDDGATNLVKIGSPVGFILSGNTVKVLEGGSLPLGILDCLRPDFSNHTLKENDVLLFLSDGVSDAFSSTTDLFETLKTIPLHNPQEIADSLLNRALAIWNNTPKDDMTVVAVRLFKAA